MIDNAPIADGIQLGFAVKNARRALVIDAERAWSRSSVDAPIASSASTSCAALTEWEPAIDYGWPNATAEERAALKALGMPRGVLHALATLWADRGRHDAGYSPSAVAALYRLATQENLTRDEWDEVAVLVEGDGGSSLLNELLIDLPNRAQPRRAPNHERSD